jgi:hypothetical protein
MGTDRKVRGGACDDTDRRGFRRSLRPTGPRVHPVYSSYPVCRLTTRAARQSPSSAGVSNRRREGRQGPSYLSLQVEDVEGDRLEQEAIRALILP